MDRAAKLEARGGASNPNTMASSKPEESKPAAQVTSSAIGSSSQPEASRNTPTQVPIEDVFNDPKPKKAKVDLDKLMRLTEMKKTYQVSKKLCRVQFSLLCGILFHYVFFAYNVKYCNI